MKEFGESRSPRASRPHHYVERDRPKSTCLSKKSQALVFQGLSVIVPSVFPQRRTQSRSRSRTRTRDERRKPPSCRAEGRGRYVGGRDRDGAARTRAMVAGNPRARRDGAQRRVDESKSSRAIGRAATSMRSSPIRPRSARVRERARRARPRAIRRAGSRDGAHLLERQCDRCLESFAGIGEANTPRRTLHQHDAELLVELPQ